MKLTKNFNKSEFDCNDGSEMPEEVLNNIKELADNLQVLRDKLRLPITINSGYRSPEYNKKIGGVKNSQHILGKAADIRVTSMSPQIVGKIITNMIDDGLLKEGGVGVYSTFVHYDIRGTKARWNG